MCQPGRPSLHGLGQLGSSGADACQSTKSSGCEQADLCHVVIEQAHLLVRKLAKVDAALTSDPQDVVIDVGDVTHAPDGEPGVAKAPVEHVEHVIDERVAEVRRVVRGDAADVDADLSAPRLEGHHLLAGGVEQLHSTRFYGAPRGAPPQRSCSRTCLAASSTDTLFLKLSRDCASSNPNQPASAISAGSGCSSASAGASTM